MHPQTATTPALATCAAQAQGKFWEMNTLVWERGFGKDLSKERMVLLAEELKLDMRRFKADLEGEACSQDVKGDQKLLSAVGVRGTPAFFINGRYLSGAQPIENFRKLIDEELQKADHAIKRGVHLRDYYETEVVAKGKTSL